MRDVRHTKMRTKNSHSGGLALCSSGGIVYYLHHNSEKFRKLTNFQSKTALVIMPALFLFAVTSENSVVANMKTMAREADHAQKMTEWAEKRVAVEELQNKKFTTTIDGVSYAPTLSAVERDNKLKDLYQKSVLEGLRVVVGDKLMPHHVVANFWQAHPFQILLVVGVPAVGYILHKVNTGKEIILSQKILQTRVVGQFTAIALLLGLMGFKEYMDQYGTFITETEAQRRVYEMVAAQKELQYRLAEGMMEQEHALDAVHRMHKVQTAKTSTHDVNPNVSQDSY
jgi:hypothetical protein